MQNLLVQAKIMSNGFLFRNPSLFLTKNAKSAGPSENHHWIAKCSFLGIHPFQRFIVCEMLEFWKDLLVNERMKAFYCKADELDHVWFDLREEVIIHYLIWLTGWHVDYFLARRLSSVRTLRFILSYWLLERIKMYF